MKPLTIKGQAAMDEFLRSLPEKLARNVVRGGMRALATVVADEARLLVTSDDVRPTIGVSSRVYPDGTIAAKVRTKGKGAFIAPWLEHGTAAHFISVSMESRPSAQARGGQRKWAIGLINRAVKRGSLIIGNNYVGTSVHHPGSKPHPFLRPAADTKFREGLEAMGQYISTRLTKEGLNAPAIGIGSDE